MGASGTRGGDADSLLIEVIFVIARSEEDQCYLAWSPQLGNVRDGQTEEEALAMCKEALEVLFEGLMERGTLEQYLLGHGYVAETRYDEGDQRFCVRNGPLFESKQIRGFDLPEHLLMPSLFREVLSPRIGVAHV